MKDVIKDAMKSLTKKTGEAGSTDALKYSQAVANLSNAWSTWDTNKRNNKQAGMTE